MTQSVGQTLVDIDEVEKKLLDVKEANEFIVNVDGGHVKTTENQRSIEALASVIYRPEALISNKKGTINHLSKNKNHNLLAKCKYVIEEPLIYKGLQEGFPRYNKTPVNSTNKSEPAAPFKISSI